jgi:hypothetical protein
MGHRAKQLKGCFRSDVANIRLVGNQEQDHRAIKRRIRASQHFDIAALTEAIPSLTLGC